MKKIAIGFALFVVGIISGGVLTYVYAPRVETQIIKEYNELSESEMLKMALSMHESKFDKYAIGKNGDWGCLQITDQYVKECNRIVGYEKYKHEDAFIPYMAFEMFDVYQTNKNPELNIDKAIILHNPNGVSLGYPSKVMDAYLNILKYEEIRKEVVR